jgi:hypothetical protein
MKSYKLTRRKEKSPFVLVKVEDAYFKKPKIPCTFIKNVHGIQRVTAVAAVQEAAAFPLDRRLPL